MVVFEYGSKERLTGIVSDEDADLVSLPWGKSNGYAQGAQGIYCGKLLHRIILERKLGRPLLKNEYTDHIDGNRGNNSRGNLRVATNSQNQANRPKSARSSTGVKGVYYDKTPKFAKKPYRPIVVFAGKAINLSPCATLGEASTLYDQKALELFGEYAKLNNYQETV